MQSIRVILILLAVYATPLYAAEGDTYGVIQFAIADVDTALGDADPTALVGRFGKFMTDSVSLEGRFGIGLSDDETEFLGIDVDIDIETIIGVYVLGHATTGGDNSFYGLIGITRGEIEASALGESDSDSETDLSFGFGVNLGSINIEFVNYIDDDDVEATAISLGYIF